MDIVNLFYPGEKIAGLAISDSSLRLLLLRKTDSAVYAAAQAGVRLAGPVLENGEVKDKEGLISALRQLKEKTGGRLGFPPYVIVSLPPTGIYSKAFQFPNLTSEQIKEAMDLNINTVLPFAPSQVYLDWQEQAEFTADSTKLKEVFLETLGKDRADQFIDALGKADFMPLAFESPAESLARLIDNFKTEAGLLVYLSEEGVNLIICQENFVRFSHFVPWFGQIEEQKRPELTQEFILEVLTKQINLAAVFFQTEHPESLLKQYVFLAPKALKEAVLEPLKEKINLDFAPLKLKIKKYKDFPELDDSWLLALGAALRGLIPRAEDTINSLMPVGTEAAFAKRKLISYAKLWSDIIGALALGMMLIFLGTNFFLGYILRGVNEQLGVRGVISAPITLGDLEQKAIDINEKLKVMAPAAENANVFSPTLEKILALAPPGINLTHLSLVSLDQPVNITGVGSSRDAILLFKNKLESSPAFFEVNLPLGSLVQTQNILFTISFRIR